MILRSLFHSSKSRKYPIKRDKDGLSLRARCFDLFDQGERPTVVAKELGAKRSTVNTYFRDWNQLGPNFETRYSFIKELFKKTAPDREKNLELFSRTLGISKEQLENILSRSHGLKRIMTGELRFPAHADADHKRHIALKLALLISDHLIEKRGKFQDVYVALGRYIWESMKYREEEDTDIKEWNKQMELFHAVLAAEMEKELKGRIEPEVFSEEEQKLLMRLGAEKEMKNTGIAYWMRIGALMAEGLSEVEAREKIRKDILDKVTPPEARMFCEFQDKIHPLKANDQEPPSNSPQPPSDSPKPPPAAKPNE